MRVIKERGEKFEVDPDRGLPQVMDLVPDGGDLDQEVRRLENTYFDTPGAGLRMFGITLRRRVGGSETGWQLKVPNGTARTELQSGSRTDTTARIGGGNSWPAGWRDSGAGRDTRNDSNGVPAPQCHR